MNAHPETCDPSLLERYLADLLSLADEADFLRHLEFCEACRQQIQLVAADPSSWSDAEDFLRDQPFEATAFGTSSSDHQNQRDNVRDGKASASAEVSQVLAMLNPTDDPQMLGRIGGYEVSGVIGSGGMGIVLKAFDGPLDRTVAIKVLVPRLASSGAARRRFAREAKAAATVLQMCLAHLQQPTIMALPEECRVPQRRRICWPTSLRTFHAVAAIVVSCLLIAGIYSITQSQFGNSRPAPASNAAPNTSRTADDEALSPLADWGAIQTDIDIFENDLGPSEADANKLWQTTPEAKPP